MASAFGMHGAFTRSTFAYATFLFVVLFAPQVGFEHHHSPSGNLISTFPDAITFILTCVVLWLAVRQAMQGQAEDAYARGFARGEAVSIIGALLYAIGMAFVAPVVFENQPFAWGTVLMSFVVVWLIGSALSVLFAWQRARSLQRRERAA